MTIDNILVREYNIYDMTIFILTHYAQYYTLTVLLEYIHLCIKYLLW